MFYCNDCAEKNGYPETLSKSFGKCEICGNNASCNDCPTSKLINYTNIIVSMTKTSEDGTVAVVPSTKKQYPIIDVKPNGIPDWYTGAFTLCFVYSKNAGNFILRGFRGEVEKYLQKNYHHYFCYWSMWHNGQARGHWDFWKDHVGFFEPSKARKDWKYQVRPYTTFGEHGTTPEQIKAMTFSFKRLPKRWIPEFDVF